MMHLLRPYWCLAYLPLAILLFFIIKKAEPMRKLLSICDPHLIPYLIQNSQRYQCGWVLLAAMFSAGLMIFSLAGPTWSRWPVSTVTVEHPRVILLDLSASMLNHDISPDRLSRAKLIIHDLLRFSGPWGLIVYTSEPFILSPLTQDGYTMDDWVDTLQPAIMPINGNRLDRALNKAVELLSESGFDQADVLVFTDKAPTAAAISTARTLADRGVHVSIMPLIMHKEFPAEYLQFANQGHGRTIDYQDNKRRLEDWLNQSPASHAPLKHSNIDLPVWQDQGRWFLIPAFMLLLPLFQRGAKQRMLR